VISHRHPDGDDLIDTLTHEIWELNRARRTAAVPRSAQDHLLRPGARAPGPKDEPTPHDLGGVGDLQSLVNRLVAAEPAERAAIAADIRAHLAHLGLVGPGAGARWEMIDRFVPAGRLAPAAREVYLSLRRPGWEHEEMIERLFRSRPNGAALARELFDEVLESHPVGEPAVGWVDPATLIPTHDIWVGSRKLREYTGLMRSGEWDWSLPEARLRVVRYAGRLFLEDGQHRRQAALDAGVGLVPIIDVTDDLVANGISLSLFAVESPALYGDDVPDAQPPAPDRERAAPSWSRVEEVGDAPHDGDSTEADQATGGGSKPPPPPKQPAGPPPGPGPDGEDDPDGDPAGTPMGWPVRRSRRK
jgi:hypothetical protein